MKTLVLSGWSRLRRVGVVCGVVVSLCVGAVIAAPAQGATVASIPVGAEPWAVAVASNNASNNGDVYVTHSDPDTDWNTVSVIDPSNDNAVTSITVGANPMGVAVASNNGDVYVATSGDNTVSVINPSNSNQVTTIPGFSAPFGVAVAPNGDVYVTNSGNGTVSVINPSNDNAVTSITVGAGPVGVAMGSNGDAYVANSNAASVSVINMSTVPGAPTGVGAVPGNASAVVSWTAPTNDGGAAVTGYHLQYQQAGVTTWTSVPGTVSGTSTTVTGPDQRCLVCVPGCCDQ